MIDILPLAVIPFLVPIAMALSAVATGVGTFMAYRGQQAAADAAQKTADYNAQLQRTQAGQEMEVAEENARRKARENARLLGRQRAVVAQSGLAMEGTPLAILGETATMLQRDIMDMGYSAQQRVRALQAGANMSLWEGRNQASALRTKALTTGLEGVASISQGFLNYENKLP
jgi:hypothetical protein